MKERYLLFLLCFIAFGTLAQKVNFQKLDVPVSYLELPTDPIIDSKLRTYSVTAESRFKAKIESGIRIEGFRKVSENGTISIKIKTEAIRINGYKIEAEEKFKKDKDGNVVSKGFLYQPLILYINSGGYSISTPSNKEPKFVTLGNKTEKYKIGTQQYTHEQAQNVLNRTKEINSAIKMLDKDFVDDVILTVNRQVNTKFGYQKPKVNYVTSFFVLKSEDHPEYNNHKKAFADLKRIFSKMSYRISVDPLRKEVMPTIEYYNSLIKTYTGNKKSQRKMRMANYYNIGNIYYYLDLPDKAIEYGNKIIENGINKGKGKFMISLATRLKKSLLKNNTDSRHFPL